MELVDAPETHNKENRMERLRFEPVMLRLSAGKPNIHERDSTLLSTGARGPGITLPHPSLPFIQVLKIGARKKTKKRKMPNVLRWFFLG